MTVIGLTGISGSGKGYVCSFFNEYNITALDCDKVVHALYAENEDCKRELLEIFGGRVLASDNTVDRKFLAFVVFSDAAALAKLNEVVHRYVINEVELFIAKAEENSQKAVIIDAPQLFESGFDKRCDVIISVVCDFKTRIERICRRDCITPEKAMARFASQKSDEYLTERSDFVIHNCGEDVKAQVELILKKLELI